MSEIADRIRFKFADHPFRYNETTGRSLHFVSYSIFRDRVSVRRSQFGYVEGHILMSRREYNAAIDRIVADNVRRKEAVARECA